MTDAKPSPGSADVAPASAAAGPVIVPRRPAPASTDPCSDSRPSPRRFGPRCGLVGGRDSQWQAGIAGLLHTRLKAVGALVVVASVLAHARDVFLGFGFSLLFPRTVIVMIALATAYLYWDKQPSLTRLRVFEVFVFLAPIVFLVYIDWRLILQAATAGDAGIAVLNWYRLILHMTLTIGAYAIFIPAGWRRTLVVGTAIGLVPAAVGLAMIWVEPAVAAAARQALTTEIWSAGLMLTAVFVAIATYGTYVIDCARREVAEAGFAGQYRLEKKLGTGGMGEVWLARHSMLARPAAIKVIRPETLVRSGGARNAEAIATAMKRFEREARSTASLTSPHTIELYDFGTTADGSFYYVMEYLDGLDLDTLVQEHGPVPVERAVHLLVQAAESLADAHERGLIHRDVKPANIFSTRQGISHDFVKVLDFGLVKDTDYDSAATQLTQEGLTSGTPAFMPPEIALGRHDVDGRADLYALGCVGYWLTTGQYVFPSSSPMEMIVNHVKAEPAPPSSRSEMRVPRQFDEVILRALAKDPDARFPSMRAFVKALEKVPLEETWDSDKAEAWWMLHVPDQGAGAGLTAPVGVAVPSVSRDAGHPGAGDLVSAGRAAG
jgi:serine/threonine-protein kinase